MKNKSKELLNIFIGMLEHVSSNRVTAREYLIERGYDIDRVVNNNLRFINKIKTEQKAKTMRAQFVLEDDQMRSRAKEMANNLISDPSFSIQRFGKHEQFAFNFRNLELLSKEELKDIIEDYFFLKMSDKNKNNG